MILDDSSLSAKLFSHSDAGRPTGAYVSNYLISLKKISN